MNFKTNKIKLIARVMLLVLLATSALSFAGCGKKTNIDLDKRFNIDDGQIKFLCMRSISAVFPEYSITKRIWSDGYINDKLYIVDGNETYNRPRISCSFTLVSSELGDGRTFYEKYIKKYVSMDGSHEYSIIISGDFYAFQGELGEFRYEFDEYKLKGKQISIYNNNELIAEINVITKLKLSEDFYRDLFDKTLFVITVDKYSEIEYSTQMPNHNMMFKEPNLNTMQLSYLTIRDVRNYSSEINLTEYTSSFVGGYYYVDKRIEYYTEITNEVDMAFINKSLEANIKIESEFYEYRAPMGKIEYVFVGNREKGECVELYTNSYLVGKIFYSSDSEISQNWLSDFLDENLVVININK